MDLQRTTSLILEKGSKQEEIVQETSQLRHGEESLCQVKSKSDVHIGTQYRIQLNPLLKKYMSYM